MTTHDDNFSSLNLMDESAATTLYIVLLALSTLSKHLAHVLLLKITLKADLHGTTLLHTPSLQQAYNMNCFL